MSRIGKQLIHIPQGVDVKLSAGRVEVKGPKGMFAIGSVMKFCLLQINLP